MLAYLQHPARIRVARQHPAFVAVNQDIYFSFEIGPAQAAQQGRNQQHVADLAGGYQ
jgi:hypothetical protein